MNYQMINTKLNIEYFQIISEILKNPDVESMKNYRQHYNTSCFRHCLEVSYLAYIICKKFNLDYISAARAGLLHDLFLYDWRLPHKDLPVKGKHAFAHPKIALMNSSQLFKLNKKEKDIILKHMWPVTLWAIPRYKESFIITIIDKYSAIKSFIEYYSKLINQTVSHRLTKTQKYCKIKDGKLNGCV